MAFVRACVNTYCMLDQSLLERGPYHWLAGSVVEKLSDSEVTQGWPRERSMYSINSHGFRGSEFESGGVAVIGCSHTFGYGQLEADIWPTLVGRSLALPVCNFGWPGSGSDTHSRVALTWLHRVQPRVVVHLDVYPNRREFMWSEWQNEIATGRDDAEWQSRLCLSETEQWLNTERNRRTVAHIAQECAAQYVYINRSTFKNQFSRISTGRPARDGVHPTTDCHRAIADFVHQSLSE